MGGQVAGVAGHWPDKADVRPGWGGVRKGFAAVAAPETARREFLMSISTRCAVQTQQRHLAGGVTAAARVWAQLFLYA